MGMNENLPINVDDNGDVGNITYANEVISIIAGIAAGEVDGVASMTATASSIADLFGRAKPVTRGVKVEVGTEEASVDLMLTVEYGKPIHKVCVEVQEGVRKAIETMTGLHVLKVDVHVMGVSFERETQEIEQGYVKATEADVLREPVESAETADDDIDTDIPDEPELDVSAHGVEASETEPNEAEEE